MSATKKTTGRRFAASLGALTIGLSGLVFVSQAHADLAVGNINPDTPRVLNIHKRVDGTQPQAGTPDGKTQVTGTGVKDVEFIAFKVTNKDLLTQAGWEGLSSINVPGNACAGVADATTKPNGFGGLEFNENGVAAPLTNGDGDSVVNGLGVGAYLLCETKAPKEVVQKAAPFLVTLPFPNVAPGAANGDGNWLYNVHVYPKNTLTTKPTKGVEVTANGLQTADQVKFPVTVTIPKIGDGVSFQHFVISDPLAAQLTDGDVESVTINGAPVPAENYTITKANAGNNNTVSVGFTKAGLTYLKTQAEQQIVVTFKAKVNGLAPNGNITNTANFHVDTVPTPEPPDNPPTTPPNTPPNPTNEVVTTWGALEVQKSDKDNAQALSGAKFKIYDAATPFANDCGKATTGDPIRINGQDEFEITDADGILKIAGLFVDKKVGDYDPATPTVPDNTKHCYVLVETAAPAGYVLPQGEDAKFPVAVTAGATMDAAVDATVPNTKQRVPNLPLTGGEGQLQMAVGGLLLMTVAGASIAVHRARRAAAK